jgi:hypothetical protein
LGATQPLSCSVIHGIYEQGFPALSPFILIKEEKMLDIQLKNEKNVSS